MAGNSEDTKKKAELLNDSDSDSENEKQKEVVEDDTGLLSLMNLNLGPKKKLLVLSLGGLLCHRVFHKERTTVPIRRKPGALIGNYKRSHCTEFMKFCLERFEVEIWSSAREWNMSNSLDCIMVGLKSKVLFAWPYTSVFPTDYKAYNVNDDALDDVPSYVKDNSFGQPAITSIHPDWEFYSKVIRSHRED
ncbi:hypothetical protein QYF36_012239 [Acer negundo]|nr:hypothetical protein QYF36_012239 [Acer negundo]